MKKWYTAPEIDVRKYKIEELITTSLGEGEDDGDIDLSGGLPELNPQADI